MTIKYIAAPRNQYGRHLMEALKGEVKRYPRMNVTRARPAALRRLERIRKYYFRHCHVESLFKPRVQ